MGQVEPDEMAMESENTDSENAALVQVGARPPARPTPYGSGAGSGGPSERQAATSGGSSDQPARGKQPQWRPKRGRVERRGGGGSGDGSGGDGDPPAQRPRRYREEVDTPLHLRYWIWVRVHCDDFHLDRSIDLGNDQIKMEHWDPPVSRTFFFFRAYPRIRDTIDDLKSLTFGTIYEHFGDTPHWRTRCLCRSWVEIRIFEEDHVHLPGDAVVRSLVPP